MSNLLEQAISADDADSAAKLIQDALGIESDDVVHYSSRSRSRTARQYHRRVAAD